MAEPAKRFFLFSKPESDSDREMRELLEALSQARDDLHRARLDFNYASEPELVEASVYEINAIQARYNYLLRKIKEGRDERKEA